MRALASFVDRPAVPWANGAGQTTELVSLADSAQLTPGSRPWRLSIAGLERVGPFSALPGMARTFLPTAEVALEIDGHVHSVPALQPKRFHGSQSVRLVDLDEPCFAINLMIADGSAGEGSVGDGSVGDAGGGVGKSGAGMGSSADRMLGEMVMTVDGPLPLSGPCWVLTLGAGSEYPRFQLLELDPGEGVPDGVSAVVLHSR